MCGIIGIMSKSQATVGNLLEALKRLEYRGYDSAGIATLSQDQQGVLQIMRRRAEGKLHHLETLLEREPLLGTVGIGHTRWATHGAPIIANAHPHGNTQLMLVHNGIIENFHELRQKFEKNILFESDTDTEIVVHLITHYLNQGDAPRHALQKSLAELEGAFALVVMFRDCPETLYGARQGSPLVIGYGMAGQDQQQEYFFGSDALALAGLAQEICYMEDGDYAEISLGKVVLYNQAGIEITRPTDIVAISNAMIGKGKYRHFMLKEIWEQPTVIGSSLARIYDPVRKFLCFPDLPIAPKDLSKITIIACGTAYYAGLVAKYWIEQWAKIAVEVDIASEFRYRTPVLPKKNGLVLIISQSGETMDTLEAMRYAKQHGQKVLAIVNVEKSTIAREADGVIYTHAGPEIGVASTKAFTSQLSVIAALAQYLAQSNAGKNVRDHEIIEALAHLPSKMMQILAQEHMILEIAHHLQEVRDVIFLGRGRLYPIALEGALKLKEISYIHAEAYAAGELKHGPIALIDEHMPIVALAPEDELFDKMLSNVQEVMSRGGKVIFISGATGIECLQQQLSPQNGKSTELLATIEVPLCHNDLTPILYSLPVQLLAYHTAVLKGTDVDQPRNLAKSVTVE